jgi:hypothetical protein
MRINRPLLACLAIAAALIAAGCGDDDDDETTATTALTEQEFQTQANQICAQGNQAVQQAGQQLGQNPTQEQFEAFVNDVLVPNIQGQLDDIGALAAPEAIAADVDAVLADAQEALDRLEADPSLIQDPNLFADVDRQLTELGLADCVD